MNDPTITTVRQFADDVDPYFVEDNLAAAAETIRDRVPARYADALADSDDVAAWVHSLVDGAVQRRRGYAVNLRTGPSLLLIGPTGTGKTHQAYGTLRALAVSGMQVRWLMTSAADLYARLRPRSGIDTETEFERFARTPLLVLDDLGAAKGSEWVEEITYRLINHRYEQVLPTLITTNVPPKDLSSALGERVASRLSEMAARVVLHGTDRRRGSA